MREIKNADDQCEQAKHVERDDAPVEAREQQRAQELASQLAKILELEFESLRKQELEPFEELQPLKTELLAEIDMLLLRQFLVYNSFLQFQDLYLKKL